MGLRDSAPNGPELAASLRGLAGFVDVDTPFAQVVVGRFGVVDSVDTKKRLVGSLGFSVPTEPCESRFHPKTGGGFFVSLRRNFFGHFDRIYKANYLR